MAEILRLLTGTRGAFNSSGPVLWSRIAEGSRAARGDFNPAYDGFR